MASNLPPERLNGEWLEADGLGGFASGTVGGARSRRYHALLLAATTPPTGRMVLVNGLEVWVETPAGRFALSSQRYLPDVVHPDGEQRLSGFQSEPWPQWTFRCEDGTEISQEVIACHGRGDVVVRWRLLSLPLGVGWGTGPRPRPDDQPVRLCARPLLSGRDYHGLHHENPGFDFAALVTGARVLWRPYQGVPGDLGGGRRQLPPRPALVSQLPLPGGGRARPRRQRGSGLARRLHLDAQRPRRDARAVHGRSRARGRPGLADRARGQAPARRFASPLQRAADAYVVQRGQGKTIVAGYPWFTDWGRDTLITLRGFMTLPDGLDLARRHPARLGRYGLRGHAAQPLPGFGRACPSTTRSMPRSGTSSPRTSISRRRAMRPPPATAKASARRGRQDRRRLSRRHPLRHPHGRGRPARGRGAGGAADLDGRQDRRLGGDAADRQAGRDPGAVAQRAQDHGPHLGALARSLPPRAGLVPAALLERAAGLPVRRGRRRSRRGPERWQPAAEPDPRGRRPAVPGRWSSPMPQPWSRRSSGSC